MKDQINDGSMKPVAESAIRPSKKTAPTGAFMFGTATTSSSSIYLYQIWTKRRILRQRKLSPRK
jgi:hypothetical protein